MENITNPNKKKELLDYLKNTKIKIEDYKELQSFFTRDSKYYQDLEKHLNKNNYTMLKNFFYECNDRYKQNQILFKKYFLKDNIIERKIISDDFDEIVIKLDDNIDIDTYKNIDKIIEYRNNFIYYQYRLYKNNEYVDRYYQAKKSRAVNATECYYFLDLKMLNYFINDERIKYKRGEENIYEILENFIFLSNLKQNIKNMNNLKENEKEKILKFLKKNMIFNILSPNEFFKYPSSNKFYIELDFSMPKEHFIQYIEKLYESYETGNIQTYTEFLSELLDEKVITKTNSVPLFLFNLKNEEKYPIHKKLVDLLFIYDTLKLGIKQTYIINKIETYRDEFYPIHRDFKSSFEKYKKYIIPFIDNAEFSNFL